VGVYDVQCPPTHVASPVAIVAPGWKVETRDSVAPAAEALLRAGFVVVTVEPTGIADDEQDRIAYTARVSSVIAEVIDHATCPTTGDVVVWGVSRGGVASVGVRDTHVRAIVALFVANMCKNVRYQECDGPAEIPTLIIDGEPRPSREHAFILDVVGAMECDLHRSDHCLQSVCLMPSLEDCYRTPRELKIQRAIRSTRLARQRVLVERSVAWLTGHVRGSFDASAWPASSTIDANQEGVASAGSVTRTLVSAPIAGGLTFSPMKLAFGFRPEIVIARTQARSLDSVGPGWGLGPYAEVEFNASSSSNGNAIVWGGGLTAIRYGRQIAVAPSVGGYTHAGDTGVALGLFVGLRGDRDDGPFDEPVGLRIDGRLGTGSSTERTVGISLVADIPGFVIAAYRLYAQLLRTR
jgi:hypothetical protein